MFKKEIEIVRSTTQDEFKDFVGVDAYKFIRVREDVVKGKIINWSWSAFCFGGLWAGYRKHWYNVFSVCLCVIVLGGFGLLISHVMLGILGATQYVISVSKKIQKIKTYEKDASRITASLNAQGGKSVFAVVMSLLLIISSFVLSLVLTNMMPS